TGSYRTRGTAHGHIPPRCVSTARVSCIGILTAMWRMRRSHREDCGVRGIRLRVRWAPGENGIGASECDVDGYGLRGGGALISAEDLERYETEMELSLFREYRDIVGRFS